MHVPQTHVTWVSRERSDQPSLGCTASRRGRYRGSGLMQRPAAWCSALVEFPSCASDVRVSRAQCAAREHRPDDVPVVESKQTTRT
eukprot:207479-Rhodomonas_salina.1